MAVKITARDVQLVRDVALSHVLSRDQILALKYFSTVTRCNTRLRELKQAGLIRVLETAFSGQNLYVAGPKATDVVGERIATLIKGRRPSPRFIQHALAVTNSRIAICLLRAASWRFEAQVTQSFEFRGREHVLKPDGLCVHEGSATFIEVDLGHVAPAKFREKVKTYEAFIDGLDSATSWGLERLDVLTITTGKLRARKLAGLAPKGSESTFRFTTFQELDVQIPGGWS